MSYEGIDDDVEVNLETDLALSITQLADLIRAQLLKDSRRLGDLYGSKSAQKKEPLATRPQVPGTQRIW